MSIRREFIQLVKYGLFGVVATLIHLLSSWAFIYFWAFSLFFANMSAFFIAFIFSYIFQTLYVFNTTFHLKRFIRFFFVQFLIFLLSYLISKIIQIENNYLQTLIIVVIMPLITFVIHKFWTFKAIDEDEAGRK